MSFYIDWSDPASFVGNVTQVGEKSDKKVSMWAFCEKRALQDCNLVSAFGANKVFKKPATAPFLKSKGAKLLWHTKEFRGVGKESGSFVKVHINVYVPSLLFAPRLRVCNYAAKVTRASKSTKILLATGESHKIRQRSWQTLFC